MPLWEHGLTTAVRARIAELDAEWRELEVRLAAEPEPSESERDTMLGRLDEIEYEIDELVRGVKGKSATTGSSAAADFC